MPCCLRARPAQHQIMQTNRAEKVEQVELFDCNNDRGRRDGYQN